MPLPATLPPGQAIRLLPENARVVGAPGCGTPETLLRALGETADLLPAPTLYSGLQLGGYPFLDAVREGHLRYLTWHPYGPARHAAEYVPARASAVPALLDHWRTDAALVRVSPPDRNGYCSLGPSASYVRAAVTRAKVVLAEVDPLVPRTHGDTAVHVSELTALVEADTPMCEYHEAARDPLGDRIAAHVLDLLPDRPVLQFGLGSVPESLIHALAGSGLRGVRVVGMATDAMVALFQQGVLSPLDMMPGPAVSAVELMGTRTLMEFADGNPSIGVFDSRTGHTPRHLGGLPGLVSVNSAVEVDLLGQVNAETVRERQVSGVGGAADFAESAHGSPGGLSVIAMASTTPDGKHSRIVPALAPGAVATIPRHTPDAVVTEYGVAWLRGKTTTERAESLAHIAHPNHRAGLTK
ncbi:4-hydroxybutyrate CoA-transferase [Acrocarpospora pleiomorpha]|uniref:4-hydroxybutyrate CoA-transferase n=1 Tax=Acrocarpospora pleiomorpha TaxID=90975 RepID=A0A5M3XUF7_9ACTN|nr:acetyl-CoA hydrolase/transferase C-terminal domain-containing protein [Acrocarpospora pleiomorpha]GES22028.1 4-hydroxybutyrate CoA-transferase [Acrocarpospora pleiomorpha]